jgi:hypothetical protein
VASAIVFKQLFFGRSHYLLWKYQPLHHCEELVSHKVVDFLNNVILWRCDWRRRQSKSADLERLEVVNAVLKTFLNERRCVALVVLKPRVVVLIIVRVTMAVVL